MDKYGMYCCIYSPVWLFCTVQRDHYNSLSKTGIVLGGVGVGIAIGLGIFLLIVYLVNK